MCVREIEKETESDGINARERALVIFGPPVLLLGFIAQLCSNSRLDVLCYCLFMCAQLCVHERIHALIS